MATKAWPSGHAARPRDAAGGGVALQARVRSGAGRRRIERASDSTPPLVRPGPPSFFWPIVTQQVTRVLRAIPYRDVSAAAACAGAFALWALALSLLVV
jgi:hypothetical protein